MAVRSVPAVLIALALAACGPTPEGPQGDPDAVAVVREARAAHGSATLDHATVRFRFRDAAFEVERDGGRFRYTRTTTDSTGRVTVETLTNDGVTRTVDGQPVPLAEADRQRVETAVNSVVYFALLPYALADPAVRVSGLARDSVLGKPYDRVEVTFAQDGGGADFDDRYLYWVHPERRTLDYVAYSYDPTPGDTSRTETGHRFRRVTGAQTVGGVRFQDYENLTVPGLLRLEDYPAALAAGRAIPVSEVRTEAVHVGAR